MSRGFSAAAAACVCLYASTAAAQTVLTLEEVLARARQAAPAAIARARVAETEGAARDASARLAGNPVLEGHIGPRFQPGGGATTEFGLGVSQQFETGGQRQARIDGARSGVDHRRAEADAEARLALFEAASVFLQALGDTERVRIAEDAQALDAELLGVTERRFAAGDVAAIELNLARLASARSAADLGSARADLAAALGRLRALLGLPPAEPLVLEGTLDLAPLPALDRLEASLRERPDLRAIEAEILEAEAQVALGRALGRPDLGALAAFERDDGDNVLLGGLTVTLPVFQQGQGTLAAGHARADRGRLALDLRRREALADLRTAADVFARRAAVAAGLAATVPATLADSEDLARRSYEAGEMSLIDLLLVRRSGADLRQTIVVRRLDAARARLAVDFIAGVLR